MGKLQNELSKQARNEQSLRKSILKEMAALLKNPKTPKSLKLFILIVFIAAFGISCFLSVIIFLAVVSLINHTEFKPRFVVVCIGVLILIPMILAIPLVLQASTAEASDRLEGRLDKTYESKYKIA